MQLTKPAGITDEQWAAILSANAGMFEAAVAEKAKQLASRRAQPAEGIRVAFDPAGGVFGSQPHWTIVLQALPATEWWNSDTAKNFKGTRPHYLRSLPDNGSRVNGPDGKKYRLNGTVTFWMTPCED